MSMNKKAQDTSPIFDPTEKSIYWLIAGVLVTIIVAIVIFTFSSYKNKLTYVPPPLPVEFLALRFTNIPECFAYVDKNTGQIYANSIDITKFNQEVLNRCYATEPEKGIKTFNFRLKLASSDQELLTNNYFHDDSPDLSMEKTILMFKDGKFQRDTLTIYVQEKI